MADPLLDTIDALQTVDLAPPPEGAVDDETFGLVTALLLAIAAVRELHDRDEDLTAPAIQSEMDMLGSRDGLAGGGFGVRGHDVHALVAELRDAGDEERAATVERAWHWSRRVVADQG
ncbi:MAG TPA: hypothetical protein VLK36_00290 [Gaiellaceae bacterium]|nr:hypothetical protein [Gaiellaceae bacterium]